jgi:hypothetical protein
MSIKSQSRQQQESLIAALLTFNDHINATRATLRSKSKKNAPDQERGE